MSELAVGYISLVASGRDLGKSIRSELAGPLEAEGRRGGSRLGTALMSGVRRTGVAAAVAVGGALTGALVKGWGRLTAIDDAQAKLRGLGHSAESIETIMDSALASVKGTAFGLGDAATLAATAVAAGVAPGEELTRYLSLIGDTATISGASLGEIGSILNKTTTAQKVYTQELNQLADRGLPVFQWLQDEYGVSAEALRKMVSEGQVDAATFQKVLEDNIGGAALESGATVRGSMANMGAALGRVGEQLLSGAFSRLPGLFAGVIGWLDRIGPVAAVVGEAVGDGLAAAVEWLTSLDFAGWVEAVSGPAGRVADVFARMAPIVGDALVSGFGYLVSLVQAAADAFAPLAATVGGALLTGLEGVASATEWVSRNWDTLRPILIGVGTVITAVLIPHWIRLGVQATAASLKNVAAWATGRANAVSSAAAQVAASYRVIGGWVAQGLAAIKSGAQTVAIWAMYKAEAIKAAAVHVAQVGRQVAAWALLGLQSMLHAAKVAAAWLVAMGPLALVVAGVAAAVALIIKHWDTIREAVSAAFDFVKDVISGVINWIKTNWPVVLAIITGPIGLAVLAITRNWDTIKAGFTAVKNWIRDRVDDIVGFVTGIPGRISGMATTAFNALKTAATSAKNWVSNRINDVVNTIRRMPSRIRTAASGMWDGIKDAFRGAINWIIRKWNGLEFKIGGGSFMGIGIPSTTLGVPKIPELHDGGVVGGRPGQEVLRVLMAGETVLPTHRPDFSLEDALSGRSGGGMHFHGPVTFGSERAVDDIDWWLRTQGAGV